jgi:hypothetical protein
MVATGFLALDCAVLGPLLKTAALEWYASVLVGVLTTGYLMSVFLVIDRPDELADDPDGPSRARPPG